MWKNKKNIQQSNYQYELYFVELQKTTDGPQNSLQVPSMFQGHTKVSLFL